MGIAAEGLKERYLGMPAYVGKSKSKTFQYIKEKVWGKIQGWKEKLLSKAGKEILIKATAQAIPEYTMTCFDLTKDLCDELSSMIRRFSGGARWINRKRYIGCRGINFQSQRRMED